MNRIYQGKVNRVEILKPGPRGKKLEEWEPLKDWHTVLWRHHELFQDAVNYYTLALAAMAEGVQPDTPEGKAILGWRDQVRNSWVDAKRKAIKFDGPHQRITKLLGLDPTKSDFDKCGAELLKHSPSSQEQRVRALLQLMEEVNKEDLNQVCVARLSFLCTAHDKLDATPTSVSQKQRMEMLKSIRIVHESNSDFLIEAAEKLDAGHFVVQPPKDYLTGEEAVEEVLHQWNAATKKVPPLNKHEEKFKTQIKKTIKDLKVPNLGRKPKGIYPFALIFKLFPTFETWEVLKDKTAGEYKKALKPSESQSVFSKDFLYEARTKQDQPLFDYFSNIAFVREQKNKNRSVWFEFDLAAFIEAIKSPHRYFEDTLAREKAAEILRKKKTAMEGRGGNVDDENEHDEEGAESFGFEGDRRIQLLQELVGDTLAYIAEAEHSVEAGEKIEYTIQVRTLRGFADIREKWQKLAEKGQASEEKLFEVLTEQQAKHRDDFGSSALYRELAKPKFHPLWRGNGTEKWHADDPLDAWRKYKDLCFELKDKERPIRFTPAHAVHSPRYFIIPKAGSFGSEHQVGDLAFTAGVVIEKSGKYAPVKMRIFYSAPRLRRDELRHEGETDLRAAKWVQPMMKMLGLSEPYTVNFANCRITLQPDNLKNIQLTFPVEIEIEKLKAAIGKKSIWVRQFNVHPEGKNFYNATLRWPHEKQPTKPPMPWYEQIKSFSCVAVDLGQRDAGAFARLRVSSVNDFGQKPSRFIGETNDIQWRAVLDRSGLFCLPGEDAMVWREKSKLDQHNPKDSDKPFEFRQELWGERGRPARDWESGETDELMRLLEVPTEDKERTLLLEGWRNAVSFPEQNDKLLVAMRRYQSRIAQMHRWCWFLKRDEKQKIAWKEIAECDDPRLVPTELKSLAKKEDPRVAVDLESQLRKRLNSAPKILVRIANRILPLRGRSWRWEKHTDSTEKNVLHQLTQNGSSLDTKERPVWIRGQRGLSVERIEQIEELRKRFQSLNQMLRREIGGKPPIRRDESVPDPCPDLLEKLENIKEQRTNQTAHLILAEALGVRLASPPADKKDLRRYKDQHGVYEKILDKKGQWIKSVDFIVIEDLSRYKTSQGRAPRENSRLMKWCHRAVRDKLKQLCEVFGLPVLETPAAYSSRFCSRTGVAGFRAIEVAPGFENEFPWSWLKEKKDGERLSEEAQKIQKLIQLVKETNRGRDGKTKKYRTFLAPLAGGPIFVPLVDKVKKLEIQPTLAQADINAAINLGLRAIADPRLWSIHPRVRTARKDGDVIAREKRKYGEKNQKKFKFSESEKILKGNSNPNFFFDVADHIKWGHAEIESPLKNEKTVRVVAGKALWNTVKEQQWERIDAINTQRLHVFKK